MWKNTTVMQYNALDKSYGKSGLDFAAADFYLNRSSTNDAPCSANHKTVK